MTIYATIDPITFPPSIHIAPEEEQALERGRNQHRQQEHNPDNKDTTPSGSRSRRSSIIDFVHRLRSRSRSKSHSRASSHSRTQDDKEHKNARRKSIDMRGDYGDVFLENLREEQEEGTGKKGNKFPPPPANKNTRKPWSRSSSRSSSPHRPEGQKGRHADDHSIPSDMSTLEINPHLMIR